MYAVLTYSPATHAFTPQRGVARGPYTLFGLRRAVRLLRRLGYECRRNDPSVLVMRLP